MRGTARSSESITMVMRETPARSVWPTVSDSMLKPRRRMSEVTRVSTPGWSSTWTMKVVCMGLSLHVCAGFGDRVGTADHLVQRRAGRHHRVDGVFLLDREVDQHRLARFARGLHRGTHLVALAHRDALDAVG